jgi:hypothetical protein
MTLNITTALNLKALYPKIQSQKLPIKVTYKFSRLFNALEQETQFYYTKLQELVTLYAEKDENGKPIPTESGTGVKIAQDKLADCQKDLDELAGLEITLPDTFFSIDELDGLSLTVQDMNCLLPLIE